VSIRQSNIQNKEVLLIHSKPSNMTIVFHKNAKDFCPAAHGLLTLQFSSLPYLFSDEIKKIFYTCRAIHCKSTAPSHIQYFKPVYLENEKIYDKNALCEVDRVNTYRIHFVLSCCTTVSLSVPKL